MVAWALGAIALVVFGAVLRNLLELDSKPGSPVGLRRIGSSRESIYEPVALEIETQSAILGISLNEAFEQRAGGNGEMAWHLVQLSAAEWSRLADTATVLLNLVDKYMPAAHVTVPVRNLASHRFKSQVMADQGRMHEVLHQLVFRSKLRFQLQVRMLRRSIEALTAGFMQGGSTAGPDQACPADLWSSFDLEFHDFDLITKETLLTFRAFLVCLGDSELDSFSAELAAAMPRGVRAISSPVSVAR